MDISQMSSSQFVDLFGTSDTPGSSNAPKFGMTETSADLFNPPLTDTTTQAALTDTTTEAVTTEETTQKPLDDVDILSTEEKKGPGRPAKYDFADISGYFTDRMKKGIFAPIKVQNDKGEDVDFVPTTPEEFDEVLELQVSHKLETARQELDTTWYQQKSPVWQFVAKYAENATHPSELLPLLQGVQKIESVAKVDESQVEGAEYLVRLQLASTGMPQKFIDTQIESLKTTNKLVETAQEIKPTILQTEQQQLVKLQKDQARQIEDYRNMVIDIRDNAIKAIENPLGKEKLKQDEKAAVYELIAVPDEQSRGYRIFDKIDELYDKKDFETLRKIALLLSNEEAYNRYITSGVTEKVAEGLQKKLRIASENIGSKGTTETGTGNKPVINRNQYPAPAGKARFGRG
jgi:hypothetical protein